MTSAKVDSIYKVFTFERKQLLLDRQIRDSESGSSKGFPTCY